MADHEVDLEFLSEAFGRVGEMGARLAASGLKRINLGDPSDYILRFISSAVLAGASFLELVTDADDFILEYDGSAVSQAHLQSLSAGVLRGDAPAWLIRLAAGVAAAFEAEVARVTLESWGDHGGFQLLMQPSGPKLQGLSKPPFRNSRSRNRVRLTDRGRLRKMTKMVTRFSGALPEETVVQTRCAFAPASIVLNGRKVDRPVDLGDCMSWRHLERRGGEPGFRPSLPRGGQQRPSSGPFSAVLGLKQDPGDWRGLTLIIDGVTFPAAADLGFGDACALAVATGVVLDETLERPARNGAYGELVQCLRQELKAMAWELIGKSGSLPSGSALATAGVCDDLARQTREPAELEKVLQAAITLRERHLRPGDEVLLESRLRLAELYESQGRRQDAVPLYERVIPIFESIAQNHINKHRREDAIQAQARALELLERVSPPGDPELGRRYHEYAEVCREYRSPRAEDLYRRAIAIRETRAAEAPIELAESLLGLADIYRRQRMLGEAEQVGRRALELMERAVGPEHRDLVPYLKLMSQVLDGLGDYAGSTDFQRRAIMLKYKR